MKYDFDLEYRPQDDLFRYINGKWLKTHEIPADKGVDGNFHKLREENIDRIHEFLKSDKAEVTSRIPLGVALYKSFMDEKSINKKGLSPIVDDIKQIKAVSSLSELSDLLICFEKTGYGMPFDFEVFNSPDNPKINILYIGQGGLSLPDEAYYHKEQHADILAKFRVHAEKMFALVGSTSPKITAELLVDFETKLAKCHFDNVQNRDPQLTNNLMDVRELSALGDGFDVSYFLAEVFDSELPDASINVQQPQFFAGLGELWNESLLDGWKAWILYHRIASVASFLSTEFVDEQFDFYSRTLSGIPEQKPRWRRAVTLIDGAVGDEVGKLYIEEYFGPTAQLKMAKLVADLIEAYRLSISEATWLSVVTKQKAITKLSKFTPKIGFPKSWHEYNELEFVQDDIIENVRRLGAFALNRAFEKIGQKVDTDEWLMTPQTVNAYYNPLANEIVFPAAILQAPFFSEDATNAENFGGIGAVIGHEIGHGFDDQGSQFDGDGKLENWWTDADRKSFEAITDKLDANFERLTPKQLIDADGAEKDALPHVSGGLTTGENIGDLVGLSISLRALALSNGFASASELTESKPEIVRDFFFSFATIWRTKGRDEAVIESLATDPHSPAEFRCNETVMNINAFHKAFNTTPNDDLYRPPEDRISVWPQ